LEREIAEDVAEKDGLGAEQVYVKATGRAIERALQVGVHFQGENDCTVRVEMGSVQAIDDISIKRKKDQGVGEDVDMNTTAATDNGNGKQGKKGKKEKMWVDEDIPETRTRTLSSITVAIGLT
jgi:ribonuclease P/MRP protein subunit POP7